MSSKRLGLIIPLPEEFEYARHELDIVGEITLGGRIYHRFLVGASGVSGVLTIVHDMGQANAAIAAHDMISAFKVPLVAVVGTAAALSDNVALGDVVIASEIHDYLHAGKAVNDPDDPAKWGVELAGTTWKSSSTLRRHLQNYPTTRAGRQQINHWSETALQECRISPPARPTRGPLYHVAPIATGDLVGASAPFISMLKAHNRKLAALEMEAGGAALSAYQHDGVDVVVVRGISDRAGADKTSTDASVDLDGAPNAWRAYAVRNATKLLTTLVGGSDFPWRKQVNDEPAPKRKVSWATVGAAAAVAVPIGYAVGAHDKDHDITAEPVPDGVPEPSDGHNPEHNGDATTEAIFPGGE
ncbi:hypothetical protein ACFV4N_08255 [Actinosynnema sp. NPDC059797]